MPSMPAVRGPGTPGRMVPLFQTGGGPPAPVTPPSAGNAAGWEGSAGDASDVCLCAGSCAAAPGAGLMWSSSLLQIKTISELDYYKKWKCNDLQARFAGESHACAEEETRRPVT